MKLGITTKLMLIVIPLVVFPVLATGLMAYQAAEGIVTRLLNQAQINLAREIAERTTQNLQTARTDLGIISVLPAISSYYYNRFYNLFSEAEINRKKVEKFFLEIARKSPLYYRIAYVDPKGREVVNITQARKNAGRGFLRPPLPLKQLSHGNPRANVSSIIALSPGGHRVIRLARPLFDVWKKMSGVVVLELDLDRLSRRILSQRVGRKGYAFVVDNQGVVRVHPEPGYLGKTAVQLGLPSVAKLIRTMLVKRQGMASYRYRGRKIVAYTPIKANGWIVAVTLPVSEFTERVDVIKDRVGWVVLLAVSLALGAGTIFSLRFVRPIKKLAQATTVISEGRLPKQIEPVSKDELGSLTMSFNHMVKNLRRIQEELLKSAKLASLGRLATGVAHEIRNPLNAMKMAAEVLRRKRVGSRESDELVKLIYQEISHLEDFVANFLSYARQPPPRLTKMDVSQFVEDILQTTGPRIAEGGVNLEKRLDPDLPAVMIDPFQMERAVMNIISNALEAMPGGGRLTVSTSLSVALEDGRNGRQVEIQVADSGAGVSRESLRNIFDPFFTTKDQGTGLGLSLTRGIVEAHGGSIGVESTPGRGTTVMIFLPLSHPEPAGGGEDNP